MTTSRNTISDTVHEGQRSYISAVQRWVDSLQKVVGALPTPEAKLVDEAVDNYFDIAEQVLITQRELAKSMLTVTRAAATDAARAAGKAA